MTGPRGGIAAGADGGLVQSILGLAFDHCPVPMWVRDLAGDALVAVNPAALRAYRCDAAAFERHARLPALRADDLVGRGADKPWRCQHLRSDGTAFEAEVRAEEIELAGRRLRVVSAEVRGEGAERRGEPDLARQALDACLNGVLICDVVQPGQPIVYSNPAFERLTGYTAAETLGRNCGFLQESDTEQPGVQQLCEAIAESRPQTVVLRNYRKDGTLFWNELSISPVRDAAGQVTHFMGMQRDVTEPRRVEAELRRRSTHDATTGLPGHSVLVDRARQAVKLARRHGRSVAVLAISTPCVHEVRRCAGYRKLEVLLREGTRRVLDCLRDGDTLSRVSDEEFCLLLPDLASSDDARLVAERVMSVLGDVVSRFGGDRVAGTRIGLSFTTPRPDGSDTVDGEELIRQASAALAESDAEDICFYSPTLEAEIGTRRTLQRALRQAIDGGRLRLRYQPQIDLGSGRIVGVEALVRWIDPVRGEILPSEFVPLAEACDLIVPLGDWVLDEACRQHRHWTDAGLLDGVVAVNVSGLQLQRPGFVDRVRQALDNAGLDPRRLELELTESVLMDSGSRNTLETLQALRDLGVQLSIDDFGTGYSSLVYLRRLPVHSVKIDSGFVRDIEQDADNASITLSVISLAHHLRLRVIAEGVETEGQLSYLRRNLCDMAQGYAISAPLWPDELERFIAQFRPPKAPEEERPTLLLVDDETNVLSSLRRSLRHEGYRILTASSASEALEVLARQDVQVILSDQLMPVMQGTEFLSRVKVLYPSTVRMVLSGYTDLATVTEAINRGAVYRFLTKPWDEADLRAHLRDAFRHAAHVRGRRLGPPARPGPAAGGPRAAGSPVPPAATASR